MFRITEIHDPVSTLYKLEDESSGSFAIVVPTCGAILNAFSIHLPEGPLNVVQGYSEFSDFKQQAESLGFRSCKLSPFPCRLKNARYHFGEKNYRIDKFLLGQHALHGILYDAPFTCLSQSTDKDGAKLTCAYSYRGEESGYPFHFDIEVTYCLQVGSRLRITTQVKNQDQGIIPIADGWHPYFSFGDNINNLLLEFQSKELLEFDDDLIPTGNLFPYQKYGSLHKIGDTVFDHCFTLNFYECQPMIVLRDAEKKVQLEIQPSNNYAYLQVYTAPDRKSIALENLSAAPDTFNNAMGLHVLAPGESIEFTVFYTLRKIQA